MLDAPAPWIVAGRHRPGGGVAAVNRPRVRSELANIEKSLARCAEIIAIDEDQSFDFSITKVDLLVTLAATAQFSVPLGRWIYINASCWC